MRSVIDMAKQIAVEDGVFERLNKIKGQRSLSDTIRDLLNRRENDLKMQKQGGMRRPGRFRPGLGRGRGTGRAEGALLRLGARELGIPMGGRRRRPRWRRNRGW